MESNSLASVANQPEVTLCFLMNRIQICHDVKLSHRKLLVLCFSFGSIVVGFRIVYIIFIESFPSLLSEHGRRLSEFLRVLFKEEDEEEEKNEDEEEQKGNVKKKEEG